MNVWTVGITMVLMELMAACYWFILVRDVFLTLRDEHRYRQAEKKERLRELARDVMES